MKAMLCFCNVIGIIACIVFLCSWIHPDIKSMMEKEEYSRTRAVKSLRDIARRKIRTLLRRNIEIKSYQMLLPRTLRDYILLPELETLLDDMASYRTALQRSDRTLNLITSGTF